MTFTPTFVGEHHDPATCFACGRRPICMGIGWRSRSDKDPKWLCMDCLEIGRMLKEIRQLDPYEERALAAVIADVGSLVEANGADLGEWSERQVEEFCAAIVTGFGDHLREEVRRDFG